jgi:hypothetical protein
MPSNYDEMTSQEVTFLNAFLCNHTRMYYHESLFLDYIGSVPYSLDYNFDFDCQVMPWVTDRIRVNYFAGMKNKRILGKEIDSRDSTE